MRRGTLKGKKSDGFEVEYQSVLDYATSQSYTLPSNTIKNIQNQLVIDLKSYGLWGKLDSLNIFACNDASLEDFMLMDWVKLLKATNQIISGVDIAYFNNGFNSNTSSNGVATTFNPSFGNNYYSQNSASKGIIIADWQDRFISSGGGGTSNQERWDFDNSIQIRINSSFTNLNSVVNLNLGVGNSGSGILVRRSSTNVDVYVTGTKFSRTQNSSLPNTTIGLGLAGVNQGGGGRSASIISAWFAGGELSDADVAAMRLSLNTYFNSLGFPSYA